jgi:hypothetical protein
MERVQRGTPPVRLKELLVGATQQKIMTRPRDSPRARSSKVHSTQRPSFCCSSGPRQLSQHPGTSTSLPLFDTNISLAREANTDQPLSLPEQKGTTQTVLAGQLSLPGQNCYTHNKQEQFARHIATRLHRRSFLLQVLICLASSSHFSTPQNGTQVSAQSLDWVIFRGGGSPAPPMAPRSGPRPASDFNWDAEWRARCAHYRER